MRKVVVFLSSLLLLLLFALDVCHPFQPLLYDRLGVSVARGLLPSRPQPQRSVEIPRTFDDLENQCDRSLVHSSRDVYGTQLFLASGEGGSDVAGVKVEAEVEAPGEQLELLSSAKTSPEGDPETRASPPPFGNDPVGWFKHHYDKDFLLLNQQVVLQKSSTDGGVLTVKGLEGAIAVVKQDITKALKKVSATKATSITIEDSTKSVQDFQQIHDNFETLLDNDAALQDIIEALVKRVSALEALEELKVYEKSTLKHLDVSPSDKIGCAFYIEGDNKAHFRHNGVNMSASKPQKVYVPTEPNENDKVYSLFTASGTGKTVDLVSMAHIRGRDLTIYLQPSGDIPDLGAEEEEGHVERRNEAAKVELRKLVGEVVTANAALLTNLKNKIGDNPLTLAVSIDEASTCPLLVRSVIGITDTMRDVVKDVFRRKTNIEVTEAVFSVAGTGASGGAIGSKPSRWEERKTSAGSHPEDVYKTLCAGIKVMPTYEQLKEWTPILFCLASHNARLCSIIVERIKKEAIDYPNIIALKDHLKKNEFGIASPAMRAFIGCNGMNELLEKPHLASVVGAQALVVHLFGDDDDTPTYDDDDQKALREFNYGIATRFISSAVNMKTMVATYGIITPRALKKEDTSEMQAPFIVDDAMLIVALLLVGLPEERGVLEAGCDGFEVTTAQIVKGALSATTIIKEEDRPSVYDALKAIGFKESNQPSGTDVKKDVKLMESFKDVKVRRHTIREGGSSTIPLKSFCSTHFQSVSMIHTDGSNPADAQCFADIETGEIQQIGEGDTAGLMDAIKKGTDSAIESATNQFARDNKLTDPKEREKAMKEAIKKEVAEKMSKIAKEFGLDPGEKGYLGIEGSLSDMLLQLVGHDKEEDVTEKSLFPFTTVSYGNSELADSYVTFFGVSQDENGKSVVKRYTIMIQAKDYSPDTSLNFKSINKNAESCRSPLLDVAFGETRLMCVASREEHLNTGARSVERNFYSYAVDDSKLLGGLLDELYKERREVVKAKRKNMVVKRRQFF